MDKSKFHWQLVTKCETMKLLSVNKWFAQRQVQVQMQHLRFANEGYYK